jgi:hypothetical protein
MFNDDFTRKPAGVSDPVLLNIHRRQNYLEEQLLKEFEYILCSVHSFVKYHGV